MKNHSIVVRLGTTDNTRVVVRRKDSVVSTLQFVNAGSWLRHGIGQMLDELRRRGVYPGEAAIDLAILAAAVTAADTRISRRRAAQDSWTREIELYVPVANVDLWADNSGRIERILRFLTGDLWRVFPRNPARRCALIQ